MPAKKKKNLSAIKRIRQAEKNRERNVPVKSKLKTLTKKLRASEGGIEAAALKETAVAYSKAASKGIIHKNTASRKISRLAKLANKGKASA